MSGLTMVPSGVPECVCAKWFLVVWYLGESRHSYNRLVLSPVTGVIMYLGFDGSFDLEKSQICFCSQFRIRGTG